MTYAAFHLVFILPPIVLLAALQRRPVAGFGGKLPWYILFGLTLVAFLYTTPWDNYLVYRNIWGYGEERVLATIGYVPIEEYLFFILQPILTGLWTFLLLRLLLKQNPPIHRVFQKRIEPHKGGALLWGLVAAVGILLLQFEAGTYMGLILAWAAPVLAGQWLLSGQRFIGYRRTFFWAAAVPTVYLWIADRVAIGLGIWHIEAATTLGWNPLGLPIEEATFFLVTNLLVVQGILMLLPLPAAPRT